MSLDFNAIYPILRKYFPQRNDFYPCSYKEEQAELEHFGIDSEEKLDILLKELSEEVMEQDKAEIDDTTYEYYCNELGKDVVDQRIEEGYWFSFPALLRIALELAFGDEYIEYAYGRDGIEIDE